MTPRSAVSAPAGIRSLSFNGDILTIGTGNSVLMFYDLRAQKYLDSGVSSGRAVVFKATSGWVVSGHSLGGGRLVPPPPPRLGGGWGWTKGLHEIRGKKDSGSCFT